MQEKMTKKIKVVLVHDFLINPGGAEKVLEELTKIFPDAPIYTLIYDRKRMRGMFKGKEIHTSFLQRLPRWLRIRPRYLLPLLPTAPETFDMRECDVVISSSGAWTKGVVTRVKTKHIAYIHSPMRSVWDYNERYARMARGGKKPGFLLRNILTYIRMWDFEAAQRPDVLVANSQYTKKRIKKYYRRGAVVVYPPINVTKKEAEPKREKRQDYFLIVSRLTEHKNIPLVMEVCEKIKVPLHIVGDGPMREQWEKTASKEVRFYGWVSEEEKDRQYRKARALVFPSEDDFGMAVAEAIEHDTPVLALRKGGATEIVEEGVTGEFFDTPTVEVLADALRRFIRDGKDYESSFQKRKKQRFTPQEFVRKIKEVIEEAQED
ncbi:MAG: glycosyltransferase [Candidatus Moranbacteria bacterium]|nr:glycosyltransferase [Candidatus Moranbacteria bacterium]